jgi:transcriptional regulator with XRE-family HTH domain
MRRRHIKGNDVRREAQTLWTSGRFVLLPISNPILDELCDINPNLDWCQARFDKAILVRRYILMGRAARLRTARLPEKILQIRKALGLSQNEMIKHMGLSDVLYQSNISGFEMGEREPSLPILLRYARAAGVCVDVLIDDELSLPERLPSIPEHRGTSVHKLKGKQTR